MLRLFAGCLVAIAAAAGAAPQLPRPTSHILKPYQGLENKTVQGVSDAPATARPLGRHACLVAPDTIELTIDARAIVTTPIRPWQRQPGDEVRLSGYKIDLRMAQASGVDEYTSDEQRKEGHTRLFRVLVRDGKDVGFIIGPNGDLIRPYQTVEGLALDAQWADSPDSYRVASDDDPALREGARPQAVYRKTRPFDATRFGSWPKEYGSRSHVYLKMPGPLAPGKRYTIEFTGNTEGRPEGQVAFRLDPRRLRSEAVHVNLIGYHPKQSSRLAYLYCWAGSGGGIEYPAGQGFEILDAATGKALWQGKAALVQPADKPEYVDRKIGPRNANGCSVYALDFSDFAQPGLYRVVVEGIGCSFPFRIADDAWTEPLWVQMKGYLHQRTSLELGPPWTTFKRPNCFHPAMGKTVHLCDADAFFNCKKIGNETPNPFERIQASIRLDTSHPDAWGGWMDAGDFDRSLVPQRHYQAVQAMLDLYQTNPDFYRDLRLNIPESENHIPDIVDEALWCTELFRRVQQKDGGVPSSVESIEHPRIGEPSWLDSIPLALTPPMPDTCYAWAATAAQMAIVLENIDADLAKKYRLSAERAILWTEAHPDVPDIFARDWMPPHFSKNAAGAFMLKLTGEEKYDTMFRETLEEIRQKNKTPHRFLRRAFYTYATLPDGIGEPDTRKTCREIIVDHADRILAQAAKTALGIVRRPDHSVEWGDHRCAVSYYPAGWLVDAHRLTGEAKYIDALVRAAQFGLGANPFNMTFTTGLGPRSVWPYHHDFGRMGLECPDGISTPGPAYMRKDTRKLLKPYLYPDVDQWPEIEGYAHVWYPAMNEHTVNTPMALQTLVWGHIAQALSAKR